MDNPPKRLFRSTKNRMVAGVCGGIAEYANLDPTIVRILTVVVALVTGVLPVLIGYVICIAVIPEIAG